MEEELWMVAAKQVLRQAKKPLHYTEIKQIILDQGLINPSLKTTLEEALFKEIQRPGGRFRSILNEPGVFELVKTESEDEPDLSSPVSHMSRPVFTQPSPSQASRAATVTHTLTSPRGLSMPSIIRKAPLKVKVIPRPKVMISNSRVKVMTPSTSVILQEKYKTKYKRLKRQLKDIVFMNAAVCDNVTKLEEKVQKVKDERRYLLARLLHHQARDESLQSQNAPSPGGGPGKPATQSIAQILGEVEKRKKKNIPGMLPGGKKKTAKEILDDAPKPRRKKGFTGRRTVHQIPLDSLGRPVFPIELGLLTIYCLGEIVTDRTSFHSLEYIYPEGFCSTRVFCGLRNPEEQALYTCKIVDNGTGPRFELSPDDAPECVFSGMTANECHVKLLQAINAIKGSEIVPLLPRGCEFFGLSHPTIQNLIQCCPGAKRCTNYKWQRFEVSRLPAAEVTAPDADEPTVSVDSLYALPTFSSIVGAGQSESNLRTLLTTSASTTPS